MQLHVGPHALLFPFLLFIGAGETVVTKQNFGLGR